MRSRSMANAFGQSRGTRAKTDRIDPVARQCLFTCMRGADLIARFMAFRPEAG